jgi:hypothetical protein
MGFEIVTDETTDDRIDRMEEALLRILIWAESYPLEIFPEPDLAKAHEVLKANDMRLDAISASAMRHVIKQVENIARSALT